MATNQYDYRYGYDPTDPRSQKMTNDLMTRPEMDPIYKLMNDMAQPGYGGASSAAEVAALETLDTAIAARQEADAAAIAEQTKLAQEQLNTMTKTQETLEKQILQQGKIYTDLIAALTALNDNFDAIKKEALMTSAKP